MTFNNRDFYYYSAKTLNMLQIECERTEIEEYCNKNELNPRIDKTNFEFTTMMAKSISPGTSFTVVYACNPSIIPPLIL